MENIDILTHFDATVTANGITIFKLREEERGLFFAKLPQPFRCLYLTDEDLDWRVKEFDSNRSEEISEKIPDVPEIKSGEFAEILCFYLIPEKYLPGSKLRPPKWKWKEAKNIPAHFTDIVLFHQIDPENADPNDSLISIESKSRATRPANTESAIQKAIDDAKKDYVSRLGESLFHIKTKYKDDKNIEAIRQLERFMDVAKFPTFLKYFKAVATVSDEFADTHLNNVAMIPDDIKDRFEVILIRIPNLRQGYEETYSQMLRT